LPPAALHRFEQAFGIPLVETYGMTEAASMITANPLNGPRKPGSAGRPASAEVRIVQDAAPCPAFTVGRVQIKGPGVITEYATGAPPGAITPDGWLETGDLGQLDRDGYLFLAGRADDVINRGGEKIHPREIEDFLLSQPGVHSAAVIGVRDNVLGERPVAYVVPSAPHRPRQPKTANPRQANLHRPGSQSAGSQSAGSQSAGSHSAGSHSAGSQLADLEVADPELADLEVADPELADALRAACEAALPRPKCPATYHLVAELPVGATGKVSRTRLRELATADRHSEPGAAAQVNQK
jgi:acyl-CoA synthetase (AMP-forming)/AMP-acid ligase II